jgi:phosphate transport system substrate-binding protein
MADIDFIVDLITTKVKMNRLVFLCLAVIISGGISSCKKAEDSAFHGTINITADESLQPMVDQLCQAYQGIHPDASFKILYQPEQQATSSVLKDSTRLAFITRELTSDEQRMLTSKGIRYNPQYIATDGVALLANRSNIDSLTTLEELSAIFKGKITNWGQLKGGNQNSDIVLVFDNANSSNLNFIMKKFGLADVKGLNIFSAGSNKKVIEYVRENPNALGFIGVNWISDGDVPLTAELSQGLRVMGVSEKANPTEEDYFQPFQRDLRYKTYPLHRKIYVINREMHAGLGSGLVNYIMRDVGSLIIEKCGLWPAKPFNREVIIKKDI